MRLLGLCTFLYALYTFFVLNVCFYAHYNDSVLTNVPLTILPVRVAISA